MPARPYSLREVVGGRGRDAGAAQLEGRPPRLPVRPHVVGGGRLRGGQLAASEAAPRHLPHAHHDGDNIRTIRQNVPRIGHFHTAGNPGRNELDETQELYYPPIMKTIAAADYDG